MLQQSKGLDFKGQNIYVGIDVHLKSWKVTVMMDKLFQKTFSQPPKPEALHQYLATNFPGATYHSAYEAGFSGFWTHNKLKGLGINSIVVNAADIPTTGKEKVQKEDARDSRKIARCLRGGELAPIHVPSPTSLEGRGLVRMRKTLVTDSTRAKNRIKSFLHFQGVDIPEGLNSPQWTKRFLKWLEGMEMGQGSKQTLDACLVSYYATRANILNVTRQIRGLSNSAAYKDEVGLLRSIPGIGVLTAMTILTELETMERFGSLDKLCGFIGLIPSTNSSGGNDRVGDITPRGHSVLRSAIIESAWVAARVDPALAKSYHGYCKRMDGNKAIIRVAKKLVARIRYVLKNKKKYVCGVVK